MKGFRSLVCLGLFAGFSLFFIAGCGSSNKAPDSSDVESPAPTSTLEKIRERGKLRVGVNTELPGFGYAYPDGEIRGFDIDFGRAIAAAVLGDAAELELVPLTAAERLSALREGRIDVLIRNTTWTLSRDSKEGINWAAITFYDGQGLMVRKESDRRNITDLDGATIALISGTTSEVNIAEAFLSINIHYTPLVFETTQQTVAAYREGKADTISSDKSQLAAFKSTMNNPEEHIILDVTLSKEPIGPATAEGDDQWNDIVRWVVWGMMQAEELGVDSSNISEKLLSADPPVRQLLGISGDLGSALGLSNDFMIQVLKQVGNYAEVYDRHLGPEGIDIPRGPNRLWKEGGLLYPMAYR